MRNITIVILATILVVCLFPVGVLADIEDPIGVNTDAFYINTENGGEAVITLSITNKLEKGINIEVSDWHDYTSTGEKETSVNPEWITSISPDSQLVPQNGAMTTNIVFNIPEEAEEVRYKTWLKIKVLDYPQEGGYWEKPITVIIRKGQAIDEVDFSVTPAYYRMSVNEYNAHITVDTSGSNEFTSYTPIKVRNKCGIDVSAYATAEDKGSPLVISETSAIDHTASEIGLAYENISTLTAQEWFSTPYTKDNPLVVNPQRTESLEWSINIPDDLENGHYVFGVRIASTNNADNMVNINYVIWMLLDVERGSQQLSTFWWVVIGTIVILTGIYVMRKVKERYWEGE